MQTSLVAYLFLFVGLMCTLMPTAESKYPCIRGIRNNGRWKERCIGDWQKLGQPCFAKDDCVDGLTCPPQFSVPGTLPPPGRCQALKNRCVNGIRDKGSYKVSCLGDNLNIGRPCLSPDDCREGLLCPRPRGHPGTLSPPGKCAARINLCINGRRDKGSHHISCLGDNLRVGQKCAYSDDCESGLRCPRAVNPGTMIQTGGRCEV